MSLRHCPLAGRGSPTLSRPGITTEGVVPHHDPHHLGCHTGHESEVDLHCVHAQTVAFVYYRTTVTLTNAQAVTPLLLEYFHAEKLPALRAVHSVCELTDHRCSS